MKTKVIAAVVAAAAAFAAQADKVVLKSGSSLSGETGDIVGDALKFKSDDLGDIENMTQVVLSSERVE